MLIVPFNNALIKVILHVDLLNIFFAVIYCRY